MPIPDTMTKLYTQNHNTTTKKNKTVLIQEENSLLLIYKELAFVHFAEMLERVSHFQRLVYRVPTNCPEVLTALSKKHFLFFVRFKSFARLVRRVVVYIRAFHKIMIKYIW